MIENDPVHSAGLAAEGVFRGAALFKVALSDHPRFFDPHAWKR